MIRFIDNNTVLINYYYKDDTVMAYRLKQAGLKIVFIDYKGKKKDKRNLVLSEFSSNKRLDTSSKLRNRRG